MTLQVHNIKCGGCANTIQKRLSEQFEGVSVDVDAGTVSADLSTPEAEQRFRQLLKQLGYPPIDETLGGFESGVAKAKSFVSCAVGRVGSKS